MGGSPMPRSFRLKASEAGTWGGSNTACTSTVSCAIHACEECGVCVCVCVCVCVIECDCVCVCVCVSE